jgi:thymidylate synthase
MMFNIIVAVDSKWAIGNKGELPWSSEVGKADMKYFVSLTTSIRPDKSRRRVAVIMGTNTRKSLPKGYLPGRINIFISRSHKNIVIENIHTTNPLVYVPSLQAAADWCDFSKSTLDEVFVIGGAQIYAEALKHPRLNKVYISMIGNGETYEADVYFPYKLLGGFDIIEQRQFENDGGRVSIVVYKRKNPDEQKYLDLARRILVDGRMKSNRSVHDALTVFGETITVSLADTYLSSSATHDEISNNFANPRRIIPMLTTKWVNWSAVFWELMWFMSGHANIDMLKKHNVVIWDVDTSQKSISLRGLDYPVGSTGPIYGVQWRHAGGKITYAADGSYTIDGGVDQLQNVINNLKKNPYSRYHVVNSWNAQQIKDMVLPPCHYSFEFMVEPVIECGVQINVLNCMVHMRSTDVGLGLPFNLASYGLLTHIVSMMTGYYPGKLMITMTDCHIYENHIDAIKKQLEREPMPFPVIEFSDKFLAAVNTGKIDKVADLDITDCSIVYMPHERIIMPFPELK